VQADGASARQRQSEKLAFMKKAGTEKQEAGGPPLSPGRRSPVTTGTKSRQRSSERDRKSDDKSGSVGSWLGDPRNSDRLLGYCSARS
jgi:hypothetical protein